MPINMSRRALFRALSPASTPQQQAPVAMRALIGEACVEPRGVMCRRCGDECDAGAIRFRPIGGGKALAALDTSLCTGCEACLPVCPTAAIALIPADRALVASELARLGGGA